MIKVRKQIILYLSVFGWPKQTGPTRAPFVVINRIIGDGKTGTFLGYSVYSFQNDDSLSVQFTGGWGADGVQGDYTIISGTGAYVNAKGDGNFVRTGGTKTTSFLDVTMNVQ